MRFLRRSALVLPLAAAIISGCGIKRPPANVFPGTEAYRTRVEQLKITPSQAYKIAYDQAKADGQLQYVSRAPTVIARRSYVFSLPRPSGADLRGYHVNGDDGSVKFINEKKTVPHSGR